ncbi:MAG: multicopper oxidase [Terriglobales bacterium]
MAITRRSFLEKSGIATMALALRGGTSYAMSHPAPSKVRIQLMASSLAQFVDPLPLPEIIQPSGHRPSTDSPNSNVQLPYYRVEMKQFEAQLHRDLKPTRLWGYASSMPGPSFETRSGQGVLVEWVNALPQTHILPIDHTIHGAESDKPEVRAVVHLHGAKAPPESDGYPENWFVPGKSAICHYPNRQDATMLWYHDHALGINRLNVFAGLFGAFIVRDEFEDSLNLPRGKYEVPLVICDRILDLEAQLNYPVSAGDPKSPWVPEVFGDAILVNGKIYPYLEVEPRKYRFRVLNGANGRFFHLTFSDAQKPNAPLLSGLSFHQIGTDQGLLPAPVPLKLLAIAPGERADLIVDFSGNAGNNIILKNDTLNVMQLRVAAKGARDESAMPQTLRPVPRIPESAAVKTRDLSLVEIDDLVQRPVKMLLNNTHWSMPVTENPVLDSTEIWNLINTTDDAHPIHLHLVKFQILDRRSFSIADYWMKHQVRYTAPVVLPEPGEAGWKDTVRADPGMVTRIIVRFEGFTGRYVWHCHILEHEDNEMMRPFDVVAR